MIGEKKSEIFKQIPNHYYPKTILFDPDESQEVLRIANDIGYPLIVKPDIGERGKGVELIRSKQGLDSYVDRMKVPFLLQEFVDYPVELGVFYVRKPSEAKGRITSIVQKQFLKVTGDAKSSVKELLQPEIRAGLQVDFSHERIKPILNNVPKGGEEVVVEYIGNHCRGTKFADVTKEADQRLTGAMDKLAKQIEGFYYGRFDLKCESIEDLRDLKNFKIVELNGVGAEPAHIYQPGFSLLSAYRIVFWHFVQMASIARENKKLGTPYWSFARGIKKLLDIRAYNRLLNRI